MNEYTMKVFGKDFAEEVSGVDFYEIERGVLLLYHRKKPSWFRPGYDITIRAYRDWSRFEEVGT